MSEQNTTQTSDTNVTDKPKRTRTKSERTDFTKIIAAHAKRRNIDTTRAGKEVRAKARREFDKLCKLDPALAKVKSAANDGNRWPALNAQASAHLLAKKN
jgi:hypothetical protein